MAELKSMANAEPVRGHVGAEFDGTPLHRCGHLSTVERMCRTSSNQIVSTICDNCFNTYAGSNEAAGRECVRMGLPRLTGTPKQIGWGNSIRLKMVTRLRTILAASINTPADRELLEMWRNQTSAVWWIENRG